MRGREQEEQHSSVLQQQTTSPPSFPANVSEAMESLEGKICGEGTFATVGYIVWSEAWSGITNLWKTCHSIILSNRSFTQGLPTHPHTSTRSYISNPQWRTDCLMPFVRKSHCKAVFVEQLMRKYLPCLRKMLRILAPANANILQGGSAKVTVAIVLLIRCTTRRFR